MVLLRKYKKSRYYGKFINTICNGMECFTCSASCANIYCTGFFSILNTILAVKNIPSSKLSPGMLTNTKPKFGFVLHSTSIF